MGHDVCSTTSAVVRVCTCVDRILCTMLSQDERLPKPLAGFAGYSSEMRELAAVISRVSMQLPRVSYDWDSLLPKYGVSKLSVEIATQAYRPRQ